MISITGEPSNLSQALSYDNWKKAMDVEYDVLMRTIHGTWFPLRESLMVVWTAAKLI
jgi:hypothetical protein